MKKAFLLHIAYILISSTCRFTRGQLTPPQFDQNTAFFEYPEGNYTDNPALAFTLNASVSNPNLNITIRADVASSNIVYVNNTHTGNIGNRVAGHVYLKTNLDREMKATWDLVFFAQSSNPSLSQAVLRVTLSLIDVNDESPVFSRPAYQITIQENYTVGTRVANSEIVAKDPDMGIGGHVTYAIKATGQAEELYKGYFDIRADFAGAHLVLMKELDYETLTFLQYEVIATDGRYPISTADLLITVLDVPDTPPIFIGSPYMVSILEGLQAGSLITMVFAVDGDLGIQNNISYSLEAGECASYVRINAVSGGIYTIKPVDRDFGLFNRQNGLCSITLKASEITDNPSNASQKTSTLRLFVQDLNDNSPVFEKSVYTGYVPEGLTDIDINIPGGISLSDADQDNNSIVDLEVSVNFGIGGRLYLVEAYPSTIYSSGSVQLKLVNNFTFDARWTMLNISVKAEDRGVPRRSSSCQVMVYINETNKFYPQFISSAYSFLIPENTKYGTPVGSVQAQDMDSGNYGKVQYTLSEPDNLFSINSETGVISVACNSSCLDRERQRVYYMSVEARDGGGKVSSAPVKITLMDVNDNSPMFLQPKYEFGITENSSLISGRNNFTAHAFDYDEPGTANSLITYTLLPRPDTLDKHFTISSTTGSIRVVNPLTRDQLSSIPGGRLELAVTAYDHGSPSLTSTVSVTAFLQVHLYSSTSSTCNISSTTTSTRPSQHNLNTYSGQSFVLCEGQMGYIQCEVGKRIRILSAVYGRLTNDICPSNNLGSLQCQSHSSTDRARWSCNGYRSCRLSANSTIFREPCVGVDKYLEVSFHCVEQPDMLHIFG